ncbi:hypothetical protein COO20_23780 [Thalassospira marina]|uniref:Uncharacterized protein n=1 Tax=Thalassospira marina TaxID=2048283 RepID=A0A2N3KEM2_9PROT|nr:hypothetical protein COO20_23780 [Thalassospira marina]
MIFVLLLCVAFAMLRKWPHYLFLWFITHHKKNGRSPMARPFSKCCLTVNSDCVVYSITST